MLDRLARDPLNRGYNQERSARPRGACDHGANEVFVPRHIYEIDVSGRIAAMCKAERDRHAALLFFLQPVGLDTGKRPDKRCLAVIDVTNHGNGAGFHGASACWIACAISGISLS